MAGKMMKQLVILVGIFICSLFVEALEQHQQHNLNEKIEIPVGVILDMETLVGKIGMTSISMAVDDFYALNANYTTKLVLHARDSGSDSFQAFSHALDLRENIGVKAIIGPQQSAHLQFVMYAANKVQIPIISFSATSPSLSSMGSYFVRATLNDTAQLVAISSIIKAFGWRQIVLVHEDTDYGRGIIPFLINALHAVGSSLAYTSIISSSATDDEFHEELDKLKTIPSTVFIVHMRSSMGARLFLKAKEFGLMTESYAWFMTDGLTDIVDSFDSRVIDSMHGVIGLKAYVQKSSRLNEFGARWKRKFLLYNLNNQQAELSNFALWAYDIVSVLAMAVEKVHFRVSTSNRTVNLHKLGVSFSGLELLRGILEIRSRGRMGDFELINQQLQSFTFEIVNVVGRGTRNIGFWTTEFGISKQLESHTFKKYSALMSDLNPVIWPGESIKVPKGRKLNPEGKKLRIGVPLVVNKFVNVERHSLTNEPNITGYCIDVFEAVRRILPYSISFEYIPIEIPQDHIAMAYDNLVYQVYLQKFDAIVGDVTITSNRSKYVDFTLPYTESRLSMLVPVEQRTNNNDGWIFLKPLTMDLWLSSLAFFLFTGFVVWAIEHSENPEFRGSVSQQLGVTFYFAFSTLVYAHREKVKSNLSRLVVIIWIFVVLILTSSYTANLTSMITVQKLQPRVTDTQELLKSGDYVGYKKGSYVENVLEMIHFNQSKLRPLDPNDYLDALAKGNKKGGVSAIIDETLYIKDFLTKHCEGYAMLGQIYKTDGLGFVFPKGSPLVHDFSRAILTGLDFIKAIEDKWFNNYTCVIKDNSIESENLNFPMFWGLFVITGAVSVCALLLHICVFIYKKWDILRFMAPGLPIWVKLVAWFIYYCKTDGTIES